MLVSCFLVARAPAATISAADAVASAIPMLAALSVTPTNVAVAAVATSVLATDAPSTALIIAELMLAPADDAASIAATLAAFDAVVVAVYIELASAVVVSAAAIDTPSKAELVLLAMLLAAFDIEVGSRGGVGAA